MLYYAPPLFRFFAHADASWRQRGIRENISAENVAAIVYVAAADADGVTPRYADKSARRYVDTR